MPEPPSELPPKTVLLVDDEDHVRFVVSTILEANGYRVLQASSGEQAIELWESEYGEIDLLFTDLQMPDMTGTDLAARLRKLSPELAVLFTSGSGITVVESLLNSRQRGRFLAKPYRVPVLLEAVNTTMASGPEPGLPSPLCRQGLTPGQGETSR